MPRSAFSLLEVMMAVSVLVIALMAIFSAIGTAAQTNRSTDNEIRVLERVESIIEEIQTVSFEQAIKFDQTAYPVSGVEGIDGETAVVRVNITSLSDGLVEVVVSTGWQELTGPRFYELSYIHANRGR